MADTEYKVRQLVGLEPALPVIGSLAANTLMRWTPFGALMRAQDHVVATSRRTLAEWSLSGATDWAQPNGTVDPGASAPTSHVYPNEAVRRTLGTYRANLTPGCQLEAHVLFCPSGLAQRDVGGGVNFENAGAWAEVRVGCTWTNGGSSTGPHYFTADLPGSNAGTWGGAELATDGANWNALDERDIVEIRPPELAIDPAVAQDYSEWSDVQIVLQVRGGARLVHAEVHEVPVVHVTDHDDDGLTSVHAMPAGLAPITTFPQTKHADGPNFEEHRFGTTRLLQVAERQSERLGPRILHLSSWRESDASIWNQTEGNPIAITSSSFVDILDTSITTYSRSNPGWIVGGAQAKLHQLCDPNLISRGEFAVVPARVHIDCTPPASGTCTVRFQSGTWEWIDVPITTGGARAWFTLTGFMESQVYDDHAWATLQIFARRSAGTLSIFNVAVDFGHW
jgi:hypothetical protein